MSSDVFNKKDGLKPEKDKLTEMKADAVEKSTELEPPEKEEDWALSEEDKALMDLILKQSACSDSEGGCCACSGCNGDCGSHR